jgi:gamma-glutamyl-gamma-aminobutyraldehyde dehydrogenase
MKLEYSDVKKTAAKLKFRTTAFIDGKFVEAMSGKTFTTENPATGQPLAQANRELREPTPPPSSFGR